MQLACLEPIAKALHITHWSSRELARQAVADGIVPRLSARTVRDILHAVDLQPHRTRYLKRMSWPSRQTLIDQIQAAWPEYNRLYAHPFQWTWTNQKMRTWFAQHANSQA